MKTVITYNDGMDDEDHDGSFDRFSYDLQLDPTHVSSPTNSNTSESPVDTIMPSTLPYNEFESRFTRKEQHGKEVSVPQVILLASDLLDTTDKAKNLVHLRSGSISSQSAPGSEELLDTSQSTGSDTSISSTSSSGRAPLCVEEIGEETVKITPIEGEAVPRIAMDETSEQFEYRGIKKRFSKFTLFRLQYLVVHTAIMLADGLQGKKSLCVFALCITDSTDH